MRLDEADPKGLVRESYNIEGITDAECRSIFVDWALSLPVGTDSAAAIRLLLATYGEGSVDHPMTQVMASAMDAPTPTAQRRGGRAARLQG